jgi:OST3 / OST6 family, transporter family
MNICIFVLISLCVFDISSAAPKNKKGKSRSSSSSSRPSSGSKSSASSGGNDGEGAERHATLVEKFRKAPTVPLGDSNFSKFVISRPRDYSAAVMFTALAPKYQCSICHGVDAVYSKLAGYYSTQYDFNSTNIKERIAFFVVDVDGARNVFGDMQFETVPRLFLLPPREKGASKMKMTDFEIDMRSALEGMSGFMDEVERLSGVKVTQTQTQCCNSLSRLLWSRMCFHLTIFLLQLNYCKSYLICSDCQDCRSQAAAADSVLCRNIARVVGELCSH